MQEIKSALERSSDKVLGVTYEYPGFWFINTAAGGFCFGDADEPNSWNWHNEEGTEGGFFAGGDVTNAIDAFGAWLETQLTDN